MWIALGGALGSTLRYLAAVWMTQHFPGKIPYGTLTVNFVGSFSLCLLMIVLPSTGWSIEFRNGLTIGAMGGFTTYSTFNAEVLAALERGDFGVAIIYLMLTLSGCLFGGWLGLGAGHHLARTLSHLP